MALGISFYEMLKLLTNIESIAKCEDELIHWIEASNETPKFELVLSKQKSTEVEKDNIAMLRRELKNYCNDEIENMKNLLYYYESEYLKADNIIVKTVFSVVAVVGAFIINGFFINEENSFDVGNNFNVLSIILLVAILVGYIYRDLYKKPKLGFLVIKILNDEIQKHK